MTSTAPSRDSWRSTGIVLLVVMATAAGHSSSLNMMADPDCTLDECGELQTQEFTASMLQTSYEVLAEAAALEQGSGASAMSQHSWDYAAKDQLPGQELKSEIFPSGTVARASALSDSGLDSDVVLFHQSEVVVEHRSAARAASRDVASPEPSVAEARGEPQREVQPPALALQAASGLIVNGTASVVTGGFANEAGSVASLEDSRIPIGLRAPHAYPHMHVVSRHRLKVAKALEGDQLFGSPRTLVSGVFAPIRTVGLLSCVTVFLSIGICLCKFAMHEHGAFKPSQKQVTVASLTPVPHIFTQPPPSYTIKKGTLRRAYGGNSEQPSEEEFGKAMSMWDGTVATFSSIFGTGVLALPYAFSAAGIVGGTAMMLLFVACSAYTAHLMTWTMGSVHFKCRGLRPELQGWPFLVEVAFGRVAKGAIVVFLVVELWGYLLSCLITAAMNINQMFGSISTTWGIVIISFAVYLLTSVPIRHLTKLNVMSNVCFVACLLMFLVTGILLPQRAPAAEVNFGVKPQGLLTAAGILVFSPAAHSFYPSVMQRMQEPQNFPVCLRRAYSVASVVYLVIGILGYLFFGNAVQPSLVQNVGVDLHMLSVPGLGWMNLVAAVGIVIKMLAMQPLILMPLISTMEGVLAECHGLALAENGALGQGLTISVLVASAVAATHFAHEISAVVSFIGSVFCMTIAFGVPVLCHWRLSEEPVGPIKRVGFSCLLLMAGCISVHAVAEAL